MSPRFRYRDEESSSTATIVGVLAGALAGFAAGMYVAQRVGGVSGLRAKLSRRNTATDEASSLQDQYAAQHEGADFDDFEDDELEGAGYDEGLEERVLEAFRNDPILAERAIDIGSISDAAIELAGWVEDENEAQHAVTIARGVPGVDTVVNRIAIGDEERRFEAAARRVREGDPALTEAHWEGGQVGTGRRRQGNSDEPDRHATPKVPLEDRWLRADAAMRDSAEDVQGLAERRSRSKKAVRGDRAGGAAVSPTGVPKADHVANPTGDADDEAEGDRM
jgi:osmotically-inducible protein OsmY